MNGDALADIIRAAQSRDPAAYDALIDEYSGRLFGFLFRLCGSRDEAEDLLQEVFLRVVRMLPAYDHDGRFEPWLFRIAANLVRDRVRKVRRSPRRSDMTNRGDSSDEGGLGGDSMEDLRNRPEPVDAGILRIEATNALNVALAELPDAEREVIMLRHFSQMSFKEIADLMDTPLGTALARAHRGLAKLRERLDPDDLGLGDAEPVISGGSA